MPDAHPVLDALRETATTHDKKVAAFGRKVDYSRLAEKSPKKPKVVPALDVPALNVRYGIERGHWPRIMESTFRCSKDASVASYFALRDAKVMVALHYWDSQGWELINLSRTEAAWLRRHGWKEAEWLNGKPIQVIKGCDPAFDLGQDGEVKALEGVCEFVIRANFRLRRVLPMRIELDPKIIEPFEIPRTSPISPEAG